MTTPRHEHEHAETRLPSLERMTVTRVDFLRGTGCCEASPIRRVTAYYSDEGRLLAESDPKAVQP